MTEEIKVFEPTSDMIAAAEEIITQNRLVFIKTPVSEIWEAMEKVRIQTMRKDWEQLPNHHHGHVHKGPNDLLARCGGPRMCPFCREDLEALQRFRQVYAIFPGQAVPTPEKRK